MRLSVANDNGIPTLTVVCCYGPVGLVLGLLFLVTWVVSVGAVIQKNHITGGLVLLNWMLIADMLYLTGAGTVIWFFTLRMRNSFHKIWSHQSPGTRIAIQDMVGFDIIFRVVIP